MKLKKYEIMRFLSYSLILLSTILGLNIGLIIGIITIVVTEGCEIMGYWRNGEKE